ncbi:MAG TPA: hypothetical protein VE934_12150 [Polaromonas sp.]|uniref:deoxynucleotide monophosphate kinase family protein n=1 Tax=Polaromonas sp. TaxID=1869339 RepID=UPI002D650469|nr:hypothetical protein [Polaromonas sp.]HYW57708.1 hypothetical protein [Polaromonas sp.]
MHKPDIIGITGLAGAGKDTVALLLKAHLRFEHTAFASPLRTEICHAFKVLPTLLTQRATKEVPTPLLAIACCSNDEFIGAMVKHARTSGIDVADYLDAPRSPREIMRWWGTEYRRHTTHTDYWTRNMVHRLHAAQENHQWRHVVSDVRFDNEAKAIRSMGGKIWQVVRPNQQADTSHVSETAGHEFAPDLVIHNNGSLQHLQALVLGAWFMREAALTAHELTRVGQAMIPAATLEYEHHVHRGAGSLIAETLINTTGVPA